MMKKHQKIVLLSAAVLAAAQPLAAHTSVSANSEKATSYAVASRNTLPKVSVTLGTLPVKQSGQPFKDISQSIYKNYIQEIYRLGITTGYTPTTYNLDGKVTRGEMATFLYRLADSPNYKAPFNVFTDISKQSNQKQILWLSATTVTRGTGNKYNPTGTVTRGQMAAFLHRMAVVSGKASSTAKYDPQFADAKTHMFANDIGWLRTQGITIGYTPTSFKPDASVSRGEMAAFIQRFYTKINKQSQPVDQTSLKVKDTTLYAGGVWKAEDNFVQATDKNGKSVAFSQVKVTGTVDTKKAGTYTITYSYGGKTVQAKITVKERIGLATPQLTAYSGDQAIETVLRDNLNALVDASGKDILEADKAKVEITAKDAQDQEVALSDLGNVTGVYTITYSFDGRQVEAQLEVKENQTSLTLTNPTLDQQYVGNTFGETQLRDNIASLTDKDGQDVLATDKDKVEITAKNDQDQAVELANLTKTAGTYTITYTYENKSVTAQLTVSDANLPKLSEDGKTVQFMNQTWSVIRNLGNGNYVIGSQQSLGKSKFKTDATLDPSDTPFFSTNARDSNGYNDSLVKTNIDNWYNTKVKGTMYEYAVQPVVLPNPTLGDMIDMGVLISNTTNSSNVNWWYTAAEKYRTAVDTTQGVKQAFALSTADVAEEMPDIVLTRSPVFSAEGVAYRDALKAAGIDEVWLRSPGGYFNYAARILNDRTVNSYVVERTDAVVPSLAVHVEQ